MAKSVPGDNMVHTEKGNTKKVADDFHGPVSKRSPTDIFCLLVFLTFIAGMIYVAYYAYSNNGDYHVFVYGRDSWGNACNKKNEPLPEAKYSGYDTTGLTKTFQMNGWMDAALSLAEKKPLTLVCVDKCPEVNGTLSSGEDLKAHYNSTGTSLCRYDIQPENFTTYYGVDNHCPSDVPTHESILNRCFPSAALDASISLAGDVGNSVVESAFSAASLKAECQDSGDVLENITNDVLSTWLEQVYLALIALACSLLAVILMRFFAAVVIWVLVIGSAVGSVAATIYCWMQYKAYADGLNELSDAKTVDGGKNAAKEAEAHLKDKKKEWLIIASCVTGAAVIILLILLVMRKRIALVVQLFHEAGKALAKMPMLLFQPLWTLLALVIWLSIYGIGLLYVETAGTPNIDNSTDIVTYEKDAILNYGRYYYIFGILWIIQFCIACQQMLIAGAIAQWYFSWDKSQIGYPILASLKRLVIYHLGTVALGSFIIALVQFVRLILSYVESKLRGKAGTIAIYILKILSCCLWCFEKILKFINKNAYIMTAIYGYNFCHGARRGFVLVVDNAMRVAAINSIGAFCLLLGKLGVSAVVVVIGYQFFFKDHQELCYFWVPLILCGLVALFVAHSFFNIYSFAIDTIFMCFCEDCERNDGVEKPYYMSSGLMKFVDNADKARNQEQLHAKKQSVPPPREVDW